MTISQETIKVLADNMGFIGVAFMGFCTALAGGFMILLKAYIAARNALRGVVGAATADPEIDQDKLMHDSKRNLSAPEKAAVDSAVLKMEEPKP